MTNLSSPSSKLTPPPPLRTAISEPQRTLAAVATHPLVKWFLAPACVLVALTAAFSATTVPPTVLLAPDPLFARGTRAKPTLTLALSVEYPTVGAQYLDVPNAITDPSYTPANEYPGYFDAKSCYTYNAYPTETRPVGVIADDYRRFDRSAAAAKTAGGVSLHTCGGTAFSGNYLNWASSSAVDILRYGLTGGDRVVDTTALTVVQRAMLPNLTVSSNFWNNPSFPSKRLLATYVGGALPSALVGTYTGDVYAANCFNRIHFGTMVTGTCAAPANNSDLGTFDGAVLPVPGVYTGPQPASFGPKYADSYGINFTAVMSTTIMYGSMMKWAIITVPSGTVVQCNPAWFNTKSIPGLVGGDPNPGFAKSCYKKTPSAVPEKAITPDAFFYARASVCATDVNGALTESRTGLCLRYPNGRFKPVGNLQKYSDRIRVAAFGYLNDPALSRYGGVLRAPMKYVGDSYFDSNFQLISGSNPVREWSSSTGIFIDNPDAAAEGKSGVTTYLNQFGRMGVLGQYKKNDPVGELYYESLRYLQGLQPTPEAVSSIDSTIKDGFPVTSTWVDPHPAITGMSDYSCIANSILGIGDVNTHADKSLPGNTKTTSNDFSRAANDTLNLPNFYNWTKIVGAFEESRAVTYLDGKGISRTTSNPNTPNPITPDLEDKVPGCCDNNTYTMAGAAYWANTHDIRGNQWTDPTRKRPGMRVKTYMLDVNEQGAQNVQATRRNNQFYLASKYGGFKDVTTTGNPFKTLSAGSTINSNENWELGTTGEPKSYFLSSSASDVLAALDDIFANIAREANSIAGGAISTQKLTSSGGYIYQAQFDPSDWSGDLVAHRVTANASGVVDVGDETTSLWSNAAGQPSGASGKLLDRTADSRNIIVGSNSSDSAAPYVGSSFTATDFTWSDMNTTNKDALRKPPYTAPGTPLDAAAVGQARLAFLRGDRTNEAGGTGTNAFRRRGGMLGDIVNSAVVAAGVPVKNYADQAAFVVANTGRATALFVGSNDGMLHAFDMVTGVELFAYIPRWIVPKLPDLTSASFVHESLVDGNPIVGDAKIGPDWKTVLVAGTGGGGQGVFALDVTRPESFTKANVMWEFTDRDDPAMGNVIGHPQILKFRRGAAGTAPDYHYYAVVTSGVNNQAADGSASNGSPALFLLDLAKPRSDSWLEGTNYIKIVFPLSTNVIASGMSGFSARLGSADEVTTLFTGDLQGNLWKIDFTKAASTSWDLSHLSSFKTAAGTPVPMFIAKSAAGDLQPITMEPSISYGSNHSIIVAFGTGKFLETSDNTGPYKVQSVYALLDNGSTVLDDNTQAIGGRPRLQRGTETSLAVAIPAFTWGRPTVDSDTSKRAGWYFDFEGSGGVPGTGERQISGFAILYGQLIFGSVIPAINSCDNGAGNLYVVNTTTGNGTGTTSSVGILGEPFIVEVGSSSLNVSDSTGRRTELAQYQPILQGSAGLASPTGLFQTVKSFVGRLSWREIANYQELRALP